MTKVKVTATKELSLEDIKNLTYQELLDIYYEQVEDWYIKPMEILVKHDNTGWAIIELFRAIESFVPGTLPYYLRTGVQPVPEVVISRDFDKAVDYDTGVVTHVLPTVKINPFLLPSYVREYMSNRKKGWSNEKFKATEFKMLLMSRAMRV